MGGAETAGTPRRKKRCIVFFVWCVLVVAVLVEVGARVLSETRDGQLELGGLKLVPLRPVPDTHRRTLEMDVAKLTYVVPDRDLGWTIRPDGRTADGLFTSNGAGLRSAPSPVGAKKDGTTRVLLVGDSYTHGDEVPWPETWAAQLRSELGDRFDVLNGGVGGYGTDQALLRCRKLRDVVKPDVVVLGIYIQDLLRNLTVFRSVKHPWTSYPWSKPRFVIDDDAPSGLRLINQPVVAWPPAKVITVLEDYDAHPELKRHDSLWDDAFYSDSKLYASRIWQWVASERIHRDRHESRQRMLRDGGEGVVVAARLARLFHSENGALGLKTLVVLLPAEDGVPGYADGKKPPLRHLHAELERLNVPYVDVGRALLDNVGADEDASALYLVSHPNARANGIIAKTLAPHIR